MSESPLGIGAGLLAFLLSTLACSTDTSGLARRPSHNPWTGIPTLQLAKISRASAEQRAGRAGRTRPGRCVRLYAQHDFERRPAFDEPELHQHSAHHAELLLRIAKLGSGNQILAATGSEPLVARFPAEQVIDLGKAARGAVVK